MIFGCFFSGKLLKAEYILSSLISNDGATGKGRSYPHGDLRLGAPRGLGSGSHIAECQLFPLHLPPIKEGALSKLRPSLAASLSN